jgi:hypothetical protein
MAQNFVYGEDDRVASWVGAAVGCTFRGVTAIGIERAGVVVAGVVYDRYTGNDICMHVAAKPGVLWARPEAMFRFFAYPFQQLGCTRVTGLVAADNLVSRKFNESVGFVYEGTLRQGLPDGTDLMVFGMLRDECRWIKQ